MAQKEVCPRDEIADPLGRMCSSLTNMVSLKVSRIFVHRVACNRRRRDLIGIVGSSVVRSRGRQREKPRVSYLRRSELSTQVRQHNSYTSYSHGLVKEFRWRRGRNFLWSVEDGGRCVSLSDVNRLVEKSISAAQMNFTHATRSPPVRQIAGKVVCES